MQSLRTRGRGRPRKCPTDALKVKAWFAEVADRSGLTSAYAMECHFSAEMVMRRDGVTERPCKFDKYRRGEHLPRISLIEKIDEEFPGTKRLMYHSIWEILECSISGVEDLHIRLGMLRPEVTSILFNPEKGSNGNPRRNDDTYAKTFNRLAEPGSLDAFTACLGLIQEIKFMGGTENHRAYIVASVKAFFRLAYQPPFDMIAEDLFDYLKVSFFHHHNDPELANYLNSIDVHQAVISKSFIAHLIDCLNILSYHTETPPACLHIAERYLRQDVIERFWDCGGPEGWRELKRLPVIRNLTRRLRKWERDQANNSRY